MNQTDVPNPEIGGQAENSRWSQWIRLASVMITVLALLAIARLLPMDRIVDVLGAMVQGMGLVGVLLLALTYAVTTVFMWPGALLSLAAGAIFGLAWGTAAVSIGSTTGAALAFLIGRYLARDTVERRLGRFPKFRAVDRAVSKGGWKIVVLLRLSPAIPFNFQNYLYGLTAIRFWPCMIASWIAMLPGTFMYVYLGYAGRAGVAAAAGQSGGRTPAQWAMLGVGLIATIAVTVYVTKLARRAIASQSGAAEELAESNPPQEDKTMTPKPARRIVTAAYVLVALSVVVLAGCAYANQNLLKSMFGPPAVQLKEAYQPKPNGPTFSSALFDQVLHQYVKPGGWVDYKDLSKHPQKLDAYIKSLAHAPFDQMGRNQKLALLLNAYNAFTLRLILDHYPLASIKDIPAAKRWDARRWNLGGHTWSLDEIEQQQVRSKFREPRVHFAMVCASIGCPPLRDHAYEASKIDQQLKAQAVYVHTHPKAMVREPSGRSHTRWFRFDQASNTAHLTKLYDWYGGDFRQVAGSVLQFASQYSPPLRAAMKRGNKPSIDWVPYDWRLNSVANRDKFAK